MPDGETRAVSDVMLPPWAKDAEEFVQMHRQVRFKPKKELSACVIHR